VGSTGFSFDLELQTAHGSLDDGHGKKGLYPSAYAPFNIYLPFAALGSSSFQAITDGKVMHAADFARSAS
jgi:hypothetical protein